MTIRRREFLQYVGATAVAVLTGDHAQAQSYPTRAVRWFVGYPPGGATDIVARIMGQWLSEQLRQPFVVENRPGASGNIATEAVAKASPDGYTLLLLNAGNAINATLYDQSKVAFPADFAAVACIVRVPLLMLVSQSAPIHSVADFTAYAKEHRGRLNMASAGTGTPQHLAGELFKMMTGIEMTHVAYRGSAPALADLLGGQVQVAFDTTAAAMEHVRAGKLRALGITAATRSPVLPEIPTVAEFVPGYEAIGWYGAGAPRDTPVEIVRRLNATINAGLVERQIHDRFTDLGAIPFGTSPEEFDRFITNETEKWAKVIKFSGTKAG